ncbi:hypothetical protein P7C71_g710, partial [Lecanoromycetidae sp. Uapishka_2]
MRCLTKAAALLSTTLTSAFVIPDTAALTTPPSNAVVDYNPTEALTLTFQVEGTERACGESNVLLNGQKLDTEWDGTTAHGREYLDIYGGKEAEWHISCLYDVIPEDGSNSDGSDVVHVLSLQVFDSPARPGFTISYKQLNAPAIIRLLPRYNPIDFTTLPVLANQWRRPSVDFDPDILAKERKQKSATPLQSLERIQKSLGAKLSAIQSSLTEGVKKAATILPCHRKPAMSQKLKDTSPGDYSETPETIKIPGIAAIPKVPEISQIPSAPKVSSDKLLEPPPTLHHDPEQLTPTVETAKTTNTLPNHSAAATRSLAATQVNDATSGSPSTSAPISETHSNLLRLKLFGIILILFSCLAWTICRCRDPRHRVECLARREERRNKKLYQRAAWKYQIKKSFWDFRIKYRLAPSEVIAYNEKRSRVTTQEEILEDVMANDIRALRNAHRVVSSITAAEEGRHGQMYESTDPERRRSVSTLPGYESEGSQPPTYDELEGDLDGPALVDGFCCTPAEFNEFTSNSSVISTSPRISRDGTNSDFDEKIETISLAESELAGSAR